MPGKKKDSSLVKASWKDVQSSAKTKRKSRLALMVLALVMVFLVISWAVHFTQSLFSPWKLSTDKQRSYIWNGEFNINLLVRSKGISLLSYNPKQERIVIVNIPDETFLDVPNGFGLWQIRAVYGLGGDSLLKDTVTSFLAVPVDGFLDLNDQGQKGAAEIVSTIRKNPFSGFNLLSSLKTDLTIWELLRLKFSLKGVRFDKVTELDLLELGVLDKENLPDGTEVWKTDPVRLDTALTILADPVIASEHKSIAVLNATDHPQLALKWARLITNLGGNVIITANSPQRLKKTQVLGEESATLKRLRQIFGEGDKINSSEDNTTSSRAQINVLLGEDRL